MSTTTASERATQVFDETGSWDATLRALRREGFSKVASVRATVDVLGRPLDEAKILVHESAAWADRRTADDAFHEGLDPTA